MASKNQRREIQDTTGSDQAQDLKRMLWVSDYSWLEKLYSQCWEQLRDEISRVENELCKSSGNKVNTELGTLADRINCIVAELIHRLIMLHFATNSITKPGLNWSPLEDDRNE